MCELQGKSGLSLESAESSTQCWDGMSTQFSVLNWTSFSQGDPEEILPDNILLGHLFELIYIAVNWEDEELWLYCCLCLIYTVNMFIVLIVYKISSFQNKVILLLQLLVQNANVQRKWKV